MMGELGCRNHEEGLPSDYAAFVSDTLSKGTIILALGHIVSWTHVPPRIIKVCILADDSLICGVAGKFVQLWGIPKQAID